MNTIAAPRWPPVIAAAVAALLVTLLTVVLMRAVVGMPVEWDIALLAALRLLLIWSLNVIMWVTIIYVVISWVNPHAPFAPAFEVLLRPLLTPIRRILPTVGGFDLSPMVLLIGFAITGGSFGLQFIGLQTASPSAVGIVNLSGAPLTVLFAIIFLGEEVRWRRGLGMALALGGVGLAIGAPSDAGDPVGLGFAFAGVFIGAFASVFVTRIEIGAVARGDLGQGDQPLPLHGGNHSRAALQAGAEDFYLSGNEYDRSTLSQPESLFRNGADIQYRLCYHPYLNGILEPLIDLGQGIDNHGLNQCQAG